MVNLLKDDGELLLLEHGHSVYRRVIKGSEVMRGGAKRREERIDALLLLSASRSSRRFSPHQNVASN